MERNKHAVLVVITGICLASAVQAQGARQPGATRQSAKPSQASEIHRLSIQDQRDRGVGPGAKELPGEQMTADDTARRKRVHELLAQGALKNGVDFEDAAFIFQHGDRPDDYLLAHVLAMVAIEKGNVRSRGIAAATLDRYLQSIGEPQVFGTQSLTVGYQQFLQKKRMERVAGQSPATAQALPTPNPDDWTQEPYSAGLISDSLRAVYCVQPIDEQKKELESKETGQTVHWPSNSWLPSLSVE